MNEKALKAFEKIAWETDTDKIHPITGENMLVNDVRGDECSIVRLALSAPTFEDAVKVVEETLAGLELVLAKKEKDNEPPLVIAKASWRVDTVRVVLKILRERGKKE